MESGDEFSSPQETATVSVFKVDTRNKETEELMVDRGELAKAEENLG